MRKGSPSVLPNSSETILAPLAHSLQIIWCDELDRHVLFCGDAAIAGHHNGFSCHNLAIRMLSGRITYALDQFDYIKQCGGRQYVASETIRRLMSEWGA